ncbi:aspartate/glutamate racemase family protein [Tabrizicola oligotrophica]|uniref:Aspartate/glutamate racemase family protein n=1 Tax=Tabrizicola oligotrophica TaxID=2710650 RepID=A0A6M0QP99_9RHOB|nr:aspartate/glutamate racemase family protein [Tabrizicola oligotrophica]NEY88921.1 aspartate/glutamate racemase family protein [Tabrizicola oligotrophica]
MHLGLITGLGPAASVVYYQRLTQAAADRGSVLELTMVEANIREVLANNLAGRAQEQAQVFAGLLERLHRAGAEVASITAIGPHFCWEETRALSPLPLLSAIKPLDDFCAGQGYARVGILGTARAMQSRLFGQMRRCDLVLPDDPVAVGTAYQDMAVAGRCDDPTRERLFAAGRAMMRRGAEAVALAGTDLLLAFDGRDPGFPVIDALEVHAAVLADLATGRKTLAEVI